jgi:tetratricopeptide (TPR) repeat protein
MNKLFLNAALAGVILLSASAEAESLSAELIMSGGRSWKGVVVGRDGDWIEFSTGAKPIRVGAGTIQELVFEVKIDQDKLNEMNQNREYERIISALESALKPFSEYSDVPSNLTFYNSLLMELYYKTKDYDKTLEIAGAISEDDRDPDLQEKSRIYLALALIDAGRAEEAEELLTKYKWNENLDNTASPEKLYITAKLLTLKKQYANAMELVAKVVAFNSQDPEWMQPAELLCAEVYTELGMYDSAEEVIREISLLYKNTNEDDLAQQLKIRIEQLRAEQEIEESIESE